MQAISTAKELNSPFIVIAPASLIPNWKVEIDTWYPGAKYKIISYAKIKDNEREFERHPLVIFDEIHYLKNMKAKRTIAAIEATYRGKPDRVIGLSGTPVKNNVTEWYSLLFLLSMSPHCSNGKPMKMGYWDFCHTFSNALRKKIRGRNITTFTGVKNEKDLRSYFVGKYIRRKAEEVLDLPELILKPVYLGGNGDSELLPLFQEYINNQKITSVMSRAKAKSALVKAKLTAKYVQDLIDQGEKAIVFTDHIEAAGEIYESLKDARICTGNTDANTRAEYVREFQSDASTIGALVCTSGAMAEGHTLTKARNVVFNDLPWVPATFQQCIKRIHRIGQSASCVGHIMQWGEVDKLILRTLKAKEEVLKLIT